MDHPPYKKIISYCTSGNIVRDDLISDWYSVTLDDNTTTTAYYHKFYGWMIKGEPIEDFIYGYIPLEKTVINWKD